MLFTVIVMAVLSFAIYYVVGMQREKASQPASRVIQGLQEAIKTKPRDEALRIRLAEAYLAQGNTSAGIEALNSALEINKKNGSAYLVLGFAHMQDQNPNEALKAFLKTIELKENTEFQQMDRTLEQAHFYAGTVYYQQKNYDEAIVQLKSALRINRAASDTYLYLGKAYAAKQWYGKAMQFYGTAVKFDPKLAEAQYEMGKLFERQHDTVRAITHYRLAQEAMPKRPEPKAALARFGTLDDHYAAGGRFMQQKKYPQAVKEFTIALAFNPKFVNAHFALGKAFEKTGQKAKAIIEYYSAVELDPGLKDANAAFKRLGGYLVLGTAYEQAGQREKAIKAYEAARKSRRTRKAANAALRRLSAQ